MDAGRALGELARGLSGIADNAKPGAIFPPPRRRCQWPVTSDSLNAAMAHIYGFTLVTRNVKHMERTGVEVVNPSRQ